MQKKESPKPPKAKQFKSPGKEENLKETTKTKRVSKNIIEPRLEVKIEDSIIKGEKPETEESLDSGSMTPSSTETPPSTSQISQEKVKDLKGKKKTSEERKVQRQKGIKFVKSSKMNDKLLNYKNLIKKLNDEKFEKKPRKLVRKNGGIIEKAKHKTAIGDLLDKYIKSGRSKQTREPVVVIFKEIHKAMDAGYTHFKFRQEMYGVIETKSMELKELTQEFLKTKYVRSVVKDSPATAKRVARHDLKQIEKLDPKIYGETRAEFKSLLKQKPSNADAIIEFISNLPKVIVRIDAKSKAEELKNTQIENIDFNKTEIENPKKIKEIISETIHTEESFLKNLKYLMGNGNISHSLFTLLENKGLISKTEKMDMSAGWEDLIQGSERFLNNLKKYERETKEKIEEFLKANPSLSEEDLKVKEEEVLLEEMIRAYMHAFDPNHVEPYLKLFPAIINKYDAMRQKFEKIWPKGNEKEAKSSAQIIIDKFSNSIGNDPSGVIIMPIQRIPRYVMLMEDLGKKVRGQAAKELNKELKFLKLYADIINSLTKSI